MLEPNIDQIEIFSDALFRHAGDGWVSLRAFEERDGGKPYFIGGVGVAGHNLKLLNERTFQVARNAANHPTPVVFCPPIAIFNDRQKAAEANLLEGLALSVECDQRPGEAMRTLEAILGPVTVSVMSGGIWIDSNKVAHNKIHLHWRLAVPARGERLKQLKQARDIAARIVGADPSNKPVCHPIRWPGSWHRKAEPVLCEINFNNPDIEIDLGTALAALRAALPQEQQPKPNGKAASAGAQREGCGEEAAGAAADWSGAIASVITGESYHAALVSLAAKMITACMGDGAAVNMLRGLMEASTAPRDARWQARYDDIPRAVETARQKFADAHHMDGIQQGPDGTMGEEEPETIEPFETFDASRWNGKEPEPRRWVTSGQIPCGEPGILNGDGGTGKTLIALQLANAVADDWPDWLGKCVEIHGPALVFSIEEKLSELHRRNRAIRESRNLSDIEHGRLHFITDLKDPILARPDRGGVIRPTMAMHRLEKTVEKIKPAIVIIENAADVFAGNENDRGQVHPFVRVMLGGLCVISDAATMLLQHPSVSGLKDDTGRSGSTGWNNAGRWRLNFTFCAGADDDIDHTRQLKTEKLNYGRKGEKFKVRWEKGVFVPVVFGPTPERAAANAPIDVAFLNCLNVKIAQGIQVGPNAGKNYAPSIFSRMPEASGYSSKALEGAMERMLSTGTVVTRQVGPKSKQKPILGLPTPLPTP